MTQHASPQAARPWQRIVEPSSAQAARDFSSPPPEYGLVLWWGWTGPMTQEVIVRDLDDIQALGIHAVMIEAGYGLEPRYLSPEWFEAVGMAVSAARQRGMRVWLVDEGKYPSGFAGAKFSGERPDLRMQGLVVGERIPLAAGETISRPLSPQTMGAVAVRASDKASQVLDTHQGELHWTAPEGTWEVWLIQHQFRTAVTRYVHNPTREKDASASLCDYLNPEATAQFIAWVHEGYKAHLGDEFGRTVLGFRGDEPDFAHMPWTPDLPDEFRRRKGYDVRPYLAAFFAPSPDEEARLARADYWDVWSALFSEHFFQPQAEWCAAHDLEYAVHLNHEDQMMALVRSEGDFFRCMRHVQVPGVDAIWNQIWPGTLADFPKLASSAAHLFGRPRAFSESFAAYRTRPDARQAKWVIDHRFVRGINMLEVMFYPSSASRPDRVGWLNSDQGRQVVHYVNRISHILSLGRPTARIAVYYPTTSLWLGDQEADESAWRVARQLLEQQRDFDFVDEQALTPVLTLDGGALRNLSGQSYQAVIVPSATAISQAAMDKLHRFAASGGSVLFVGRAPRMIVEHSFMAAAGAPSLDWATLEQSGDVSTKVLEALPPADLILDPPCRDIKVLRRRWADADVYFLFNESEVEQSRLGLFEGEGQVQEWDAASGTIQAITTERSEDGRIRLPLTLASYESRLIVIGATQEMHAGLGNW